MVLVLFIRADIRDLVVDPQCDVVVVMVVVVVVVVVVVAVVEVTTVGGRMGSSPPSSFDAQCHAMNTSPIQRKVAALMTISTLAAAKGTVMTDCTAATAIAKTKHSGPVHSGRS